MESGLLQYLRLFRKRLWLAAGVAAVVVGLAVAYSVTATPRYEATARLLVGQSQISRTEVQQGVQIALLSQQLLETYADLIKRRPIAEKAVEEAGLPVQPADLAERLRAEPVGNTLGIELSYRTTDPVLAQRVVNAVAEAFVSEVERLETPGAGEAAVKVTVVEPAMQPDEPVSPKPVRNVAIALVLGALLGSGAAVLGEQLDVRVKSRERAEELLGVPVLASIPRIRGERDGVYLERDPQSPTAEAFRKMRTAVRFLEVEHPIRTLVVTSPFAGEGKTTNATNLAVAFAQAGVRTVLVEADLRRPTLHRAFPTHRDRGLTTYLVARATLDDSVVETPVKGLAVLPAGAIPPNPAELLASKQMTDVLERLGRRFDLVIVDTPPILPVADASALVPRVDGVILVIRAGQTRDDRVKEAGELIRKVGGRLLGSVMNGQKAGRDDEGYYRYYGYRSPFEREPAARTVPAPVQEGARPQR
ncbi:MAG TPA: polysaccharide biosynthesis tyrosine autokinase [Actinomycetota bacterium]|nr:polysaccharide biosynthesis tyrosine autokinase [Actinomycetota bacterium]